MSGRLTLLDLTSASPSLIRLGYLSLSGVAPFFMNAYRISTLLSVTLGLFLVAIAQAGEMKIISPVFSNGGIHSGEV